MKNVPPKHDLKVPRPWFSIFWAKGGSVSVIAGVICILATIASVSLYRSAGVFERTGLELKATATDRRVRSDPDGADDYYVTYR